MARKKQAVSLKLKPKIKGERREKSIRDRKWGKKGVLPDLALLKIFKFAGQHSRTIRNLSLTCRRFYSLISSQNRLHPEELPKVQVKFITFTADQSAPTAVTVKYACKRSRKHKGVRKFLRDWNEGKEKEVPLATLMAHFSLRGTLTLQGHACFNRPLLAALAACKKSLFDQVQALVFDGKNIQMGSDCAKALVNGEGVLVSSLAYLCSKVPAAQYKLSNFKSSDHHCAAYSILCRPLMSHLVLDEMKQLKSLHIKVCCPDIYRATESLLELKALLPLAKTPRSTIDVKVPRLGLPNSDVVRLVQTWQEVEQGDETTAVFWSLVECRSLHSARDWPQLSSLLKDLEMVPVVDDVTSETGVFQGLSVVATNKLNPSIQLKLTIKMLRGHPLA